MKKLILGITLAGLLLSFSPVVKAVDMPSVQLMTQSEKSQWIQLLVQMIALLQEQLKVMVAQEVALNKIVQNTTPVISIVTPPTPTPTNKVENPNTYIAPIQTSHFFSASGKSYVSCNIASDVYYNEKFEMIYTGKRICKILTPLKDGVIVSLVMDNGNTYQTDKDNTFWITELYYNPNWVYDYSSPRSYTVNFSYKDPISGTITGSVKEYVSINILKSPN